MEKKRLILKLNKNFYPVQECHWKDAFINIASGAAFPVDINYAVDENGQVDLNTIEYFNIIKSIEDWAKIGVRPYDDYIQTANSVYRLPPIVICANYDKIKYKEVIFPTKSNIWRRDKYICQYTGEKLSKEFLSIDHVTPKSRGGQNTWTNLVTCHKELNNWKGDRTPEECKLKLIQQPKKPANGMVFDFLREEWKMFVDGGDFE